MKLATDMWIAVMDGAKGLFLVNDGTAIEPRLTVVRSIGIDNPATHEQGRGKPPRAFDSSGTHRSAMEAPDLHQKAEDNFLAGLMADLETEASAGKFEKIVLVAPPIALGTVRKKIGAALKSKIVKEISADYVKLPIAEIAKAVQKALEG
jgi:protein required for attachment to host cells